MGSQIIFIFLIATISMSDARQNKNIDNLADVVFLTETNFDAELARKSFLVMFHLKEYALEYLYQ